MNHGQNGMVRFQTLCMLSEWAKSPPLSRAHHGGVGAQRNACPSKDWSAQANRICTQRKALARRNRVACRQALMAQRRTFYAKLWTARSSSDVNDLWARYSAIEVLLRWAAHRRCLLPAVRMLATKMRINSSVSCNIGASSAGDLISGTRCASRSHRLVSRSSLRQMRIL